MTLAANAVHVLDDYLESIIIAASWDSFAFYHVSD